MVRMCALITLVVLGGLPRVADAGPFADDLARCLVKSTTATDRARFVRWMFAAASRHPEVRDLTTVSDERMTDASKAVGESLMTLLTKTCAEQTKLALQAEGALALQVSFQAFGQVAGTELFAHPEVAKATAGVEQYLNPQALQALLK